MRYQYKPSFVQTIKKLTPQRKTKVKETIQNLVIFFETGQKTTGLGLKKLRKNFWELRIDLKERVIFRLRDDLVEFVITGSHDEIKRYLKNLAG